MTVWVWVATYSVLGALPEHGSFGMFITKAECQSALNQRIVEMKSKGREAVGTCFLTQRKS